MARVDQSDEPRFALSFRSGPAGWRRVLGIGAQIRADETRWPLWLPVAFGAGIGIYFALPFEPSPMGVLATLGIAAVSVAALFRAAPLLRVVLSLVAALSLGFALAKFHEEQVAAPVLVREVGPISIEGRVEYAQAHGKGTRVVLTGLDPADFEDQSPPFSIRVGFRTGGEDLKPGDEIRAAVVLMAPPGPSAPGAYDFARAAFFQRLGAVGYAYGGPTLLHHASASAWRVPIAQSIDALRYRVTARIHEVLPGSTGSIASALITGDRGGISDTDDQALRDAGLAHVLAIAGLHMGLVGLGIFWLVRALLAAVPAIALNYPIKKWAAGAALVGTAFYLVISGAGVPSIRAFTMLAMMFLAIMVDRPALSMRSIALAAMIILLVKPESLIEPGFQMSFAAVVGLIAVAEWEQARPLASEHTGPRKFAGLRRYVRGIAITSFVGSIATVPYAIYHFDRATHYAVLGNLLAMPIMGFVTMPCAALAVALMPVGLDFIPLKLMGFGIVAMLAVGHWVSALPGAVTVAAAWPIGALVLISFGGLWCAIWRQQWRWLGLMPAAAGIVLAYGLHAPDLLIAHSAETAAVRTVRGSLAFVRWPKDGYSASEWLKRDGDGREVSQAIAAVKDGVLCDGDGCVAQVKGKVIAFPLRAEALVEDCARADILVSAVPLSVNCSSPTFVLDPEQISDAGGYAIWLSPFRIESVRTVRGERPWSVAPGVADFSTDE